MASTSPLATSSTTAEPARARWSRIAALSSRYARYWMRRSIDLVLSIDLRIQYLAYRELKAAIRDQRARAGSAVVLDVASGEVLAMVNQPAYNPNDRDQIQSGVYRNRAATDIFEPGSSIKPFFVAAGLASGKYDNRS